MSKQAFLRYQLQNSIRQTAPSLSLFAALLEESEERVCARLDALAQLREEGVRHLCNTCDAEISALRGKRVLFLGDSLTADELGYRALVSEAAELCSRNASISGGTTSALLHFFKCKLGSKTSPVPEIISVMLGTNDSVSVEREELHQVSPEEYLRNMREILTWAKQTGARVLLFAIPPVMEQRFCVYSAENHKLQSNAAIAAYNAQLTELARELGLALIPHKVILPCEELFEADGLHWNVQGQLRFAEQWLREAAESRE